MGIANLKRVPIVDDHAMFRDGLKEILERSGDFEVVGEAGDGAAAVEVAERALPDVVIMNISMPVKNGIEACLEINDLLPDIRIMMLTGSTDEDTVIQSLAAGATGYLQKSCGMEKLLATLRAVAEGEFRVPAGPMRRALATVRVRINQSEAADLRSLTDKERETLALFAQGMSYAGIAEIKGRRPVTIRNSIYAIRKKLRVKSKQELVVRAWLGGLLNA